MSARSDDRLKLEVLFEPSRFYHDEAVEDMTLAAVGAYTRLFTAGFSLPEPGVFRDNDRSFASTARCSIDEWLAVREEVSRAFDTTSRPGWWIQKGTVETMRRKAKWIAEQRLRGKQGAEKRWGGDGGPIAGPWRAHSDPIANGVGMEGGGVGVGEAENQPPSIPPAPGAGAPAERSGRSPSAKKQPGKKPRAPVAVDRTITPDDIAKNAARFALPIAVVESLAEQVLLEFDSREYTVARSALVTWCRNEARAAANGHANGAAPSRWRPKFWYGEPENRPTPGWEPPGPLSWSAGGRLGIELPGDERWRQLTASELADWQSHVRGRA